MNQPLLFATPECVPTRREAHVAVIIARNGVVARQISETFARGKNLVVIYKTDDSDVQKFVADVSPEIVLLDAGLGAEITDSVRAISDQSSVFSVVPTYRNARNVESFTLMPALVSVG